MRREVDNRNKDCEFHGDYVGRDNITVNVTMFKDSEREFVVTHNADIKPVTYFTGRETELKDLRQRIEEGRKSVLVSGMGGIGKTHICRKLFEEYLNSHAEGGHEPFRYIGYIEYAGDMSGSLMNCLKYRQQDSPEQNQEAAWQELEYLAADGKLLLFVDNVNVSMGEDVGLGRLKSIPGAVVLTSRRTSFSKEYEPYRIGFLSTEHCIAIYERIRYEDSGKKVLEEEIPDLAYVIEEMAAWHTITVEFLAHLAEARRWNVKRLRSELEAKGFRLKYRNEEDKLINIQEEYEKLYDLSVLTEAEQNILEAFSVFPYIPLAAETCNEWLLADAGVNEDDDVLVCLYRKGWLQFDIVQESYALHPIFAQYIYEKHKPQMVEHLGLIKSCQESLEIPQNSSAMACQLYMIFALNLIQKINMEKDLILAGFLADLAFLFEYMAEYKFAEKLYFKSLDIYLYNYGIHHIATATIYNNLACVLDAQGEYKKAMMFYEICKAIREELLGEEHQDTANTYNNLACLYEKLKEYEKAEELYEQSLRICQKTLGEYHSDTARSYNNLAGVFLSLEKYEKAEELYEQSMKIWEMLLGKNHPDTAIAYNNLAFVYLMNKEYQNAIIYDFKAYRVFVSHFGVSNPKTQQIYENLKLLYLDWNPEGDFEQWLEEQMNEM